MTAASNVLNVAGLILWLPLQILLIARLLRGEWRRYPLLFIFVVTDFLTGVADAPGVLAVFRNVPDALRFRASNWERIELIAQILTLCVVLSLMGQAASKLHSRNLIRAVCMVGALLFGAVTFWLEYDPRALTMTWMTRWTRDLSLCTTVLGLAVWMLLLARREKDRRLFLLTAALGIQFSGAAIGYALTLLASRKFPWPALAGGTIVVLTTLTRIGLWARAFRPAPADVRVAHTASVRID